MKDWRQPGLTLADYEQLVPLDKTDIRMLLMFVTGKSRIQLITQGDTVPETAQAESIRALLERRLSGEPIAYLTGEREFFGLSFITTPAVLIPRPDTELLVELALEKDLRMPAFWILAPAPVRLPSASPVITLTGKSLLRTSARPL